jgi:hypothetical protein
MSDDIDYDCHKCFHALVESEKVSFLDRRMILCRVCGNKRCPKATDHELKCTGSNKPGQEGSIYA